MLKIHVTNVVFLAARDDGEADARPAARARVAAVAGGVRRRGARHRLARRDEEDSGKY